MAYNNPEASGTDMPPALIARLAAEVEQVVAVKECSGDARRIAALLNDAPDLEVLVGGDDWALEGLLRRRDRLDQRRRRLRAGRVRRALRRRPRRRPRARPAVYGRLLPLARLDMTPKLVQFYKGAQDALGFVGGPVREPRLDARRGRPRDPRRRARRAPRARGGRMSHVPLIRDERPAGG